jgi:hypothetical protein
MADQRKAVGGGIFSPRSLRFPFPQKNCRVVLRMNVANVMRLERIKPMIKHEMENAFQMAVPLEVDMGTGKDWLEAH